MRKSKRPCHDFLGKLETPCVVTPHSWTPQVEISSFWRWYGLIQVVGVSHRDKDTLPTPGPNLMWETQACSHGTPVKGEGTVF